MNAQGEREPNQEIVPLDLLSEWIRRGTLLSLIVDAGQTLEWPESELKLAASSGYAFRRLVLLTVITYCYAAGVYDPKEIARKIAQDELLRFFCAGTYPTWQDIGEFTHRNHHLIRQSLTRTCQWARDFGLPPRAAGPENSRCEPAESSLQQAEDSEAPSMEEGLLGRAVTR